MQNHLVFLKMNFPFPIRKIIHIDMDAFFASVEQLDFPEFRGKPLAVGGEHRGVVAAASYEARKFGVHSALSSKIAKQRCPELIFVYPRFHRYKEISKQILSIFYEYTDFVEPMSLDEAYLDVTENKKGIHSATQIAKEIRKRIFDETGLTASAGISINKFLAKVASDYNKPNGQKTIMPDEVLAFLENLPIEKFYGVGKVTANKMYNKGIFFGKDLKAKTLPELEKDFGKSAKYYFNVVRGVHNSKVVSHRERKSIAVERTFFEDIEQEKKIMEKLFVLSQELEKRIKNTESQGKTITLKIKYKDFSQFTRSKTLSFFPKKQSEILEVSKKLWDERPFVKPVRLLGLSLSNFSAETEEKKPIYIQLRLAFNELNI